MRATGAAATDAEKVIAFRVHGVTPEYISGLKARGMGQLSIDKLLSLRVNGID